MANTTTALTPNTLKEGLREVFNDGFQLETEANQANSIEIFGFDASKKAEETYQKVSGVGEFGVVAEGSDTPVVSRKELLDTSFQASTFRKAVGITYEQLQDQLYPQMKDNVEQLGIAARYTQEKNRFAVIRNILSTLGADGKPLAATDHPLRDGTQSNLVSGALSLDKLKEMVELFRTQKDYEGKIVPSIPRILLTSPANHAEVLELTKSKLKAGTNHNDLSYFSEVFPGLQVKFSPFVGSAVGGSDTGVTLIGNYHKLKVVVRESINTWMVPWKIKSDLVTEFGAKYRESVGFADHVGVVYLDGVTA